MKKQQEVANWYFPKKGLQVSLVFFMWVVISILISNDFNQSLSILFFILSLIYLVLGFIWTQINRIMFIRKVTEYRMWFPILGTSFATLSGSFYFLGDFQAAIFFRTLALLVFLIVFPAAWLIRQINNGQLSRVINNQQKMMDLFSFYNIRFFLISPENPIRWYLQLVSVILGICILFSFLFVLLNNLI